jgi:hypothetical protein
VKSNKGEVMQKQNGMPVSEIVVITPEMATKWLGSNERNRSVSQATVSGYAADMQAGAWRVTHQGLGFDVDGKLIDGQHRLHAVIKANVPVAMLVTHNLPRDAQDVIDAPRLRSVKDQLELIDGVTNAMGKAAVAKIVYALEHNIRQTFKLTLHQTRELLARDGAKIDRAFSLHWGTALKSAPYIGALVFAMGAGEKVFEFAEMVRNGEGLKRGMPAHTLRDFLLLTRHGGASQDRLGVAFCVLRSVHAHIHGEELRLLRPAQLMHGSLMDEILAFFRLANDTERGAKK